MAWSYGELKAADATLGLEDPGAAAVALNAQATQVTVDIATSDARAVLLLSGEWVVIKHLSKTALSGASPPSATDRAVAAADLLIDTFTLTTILHFADETTWQQVQPLIAGLKAAGVLSQASIDAWDAMRKRTIPVWDPPVSDQDVLHARSL